MEERKRSEESGLEAEEEVEEEEGVSDRECEGVRSDERGTEEGVEDRGSRVEGGGRERSRARERARSEGGWGCGAAERSARELSGDGGIAG